MTVASYGLLNVKTFVIPSRVLSGTLPFLQRMGKQGLEGFAIWGGKLVTETKFEFQSVFIPKQKSLKTESGLLVVVEGDALFHVNREAYELDLILGAQVHTHPTSAYHSDTDDHFPLVTLKGALSLVVPNFARNAPDDIDNWAWYRLKEYGSWVPLSDEQLVVTE